MIDNLMIWDTALENSSITALNRNILNNCTAYSGNGQNVAHLETTHEIPQNFTNHVWNVYAHGKEMAMYLENTKFKSLHLIPMEAN
ncbi:MAG: hypothetical protein CM15mP9_3290 [Methanobacteriota archaeon]|nr:MAG: hypothetical protein CM15mP9_3290 [Euryarchaeota archaeon]